MTQKEIINYLGSYNYGGIERIIKKICGKKIASGIHRDVYELKIDNNYVVKIEKTPALGNFSNVAEFRNYINAKGSHLQKYLCPILTINQTGQILIMRKCKPAKDKKDLPKFLPACITDNKIENWGFIGKKPYIFDYAYLIPDQRLRKVKYWSLKDK